MKKYIILASEERIRKVIFYISSERRHKKVLTISSFLRGTFLSVLLLSACFSFTSAQTMGDLPPPDNGSQCTDLKYNLTYTKSKDSNTNGEVSDLQFFLQDIGLLDSDPTGYFGKLTFNAVKAFQRQNNLYAYGYVGATTRAVIKSLSCGGGIVSTPTPPTITSVIPGDGRVTLNFTAGNSAATTGNVAVTRYGAVCISNNQVATYLDATVSPLAITVTGLPNGVLTTCQIVIVNSAGQNIQSIAAPASASFTPSASVSSCTGTVTPGNKTVVAGVSGGSVWGNGANNIFSSDSSLGSIAQFLGAKVGSTVNLIVADAGCKSTFGGSVTQSGVTTVSYTSPWRGMTVTLGSCLSNCASTAAAPTVSWSPSSSTITSGQSNPAYSYTSVGQTRNCVIYDPSTATASYPGTVLWNSVEATHTFPAGLLGTITQNLSRKLVCFNDGGVGSTPATYTITVANSATPTIIITSPQPNANFKIGDNIPISWTYSGVPRNSQVVYSITGINTTGSGVEGGTGQSNELSVNSTSGSAVWRTGGNGYLNVPGTYAVSATINECNPSGCSYAPSGKILSTVQNSVRITIDSPSTVVTTPTLNSFNVVTSTSGTVRKDETFSMNWSGSNATRFEYNVNYGTAYTTIGGNSWSGSLALDPTVTPGSTYTMGLRACNASNVCSSTVYRPLVVTAANITMPVITSISPNSVSAGTVVTINGTNLSGASNIEFYSSNGQLIGSLAPTASSVNLVFTISSQFALNTAPGNYQVGVVTNACAGGCSSNRVGITLNPPASTPLPPTITSVIPGDGRVTLNFTAGNSAATTGNVAVTRYGAVCISNNQVATYLDATVSPLAITVTGLPNGVLTTCQIVIVNSAGQNIQSIAAPASASFTPSAVIAAPTLNSFNVVTSTSGTVRKDETFSMNWSGSNATRFEYNVNYGTAYTTIGGNSWSGSLALDPTVTPGSTYTMGLRACNASNVCSSTVYRPLVVTAATVTTAASLNLSINGSPVSNGQSLTVSNASVSWSSNASFCMVDGIVQTGTSGSKVLSVGQHVITCANSTGTSVISAYVTYTPIAMNLDVGSQVLGVSTICTNIPRNLHRGAESNSVKNLQTFLQDKGLLTDAPTGFYGDKTVEAVKDYQAMKGLPQTGMVYDFTRQAIKTESCR